jgi:hypothetical protein
MASASAVSARATRWLHFHHRAPAIGKWVDQCCFDRLGVVSIAPYLLFACGHAGSHGASPCNHKGSALYIKPSEQVSYREGIVLSMQTPIFILRIH